MKKHWIEKHMTKAAAVAADSIDNSTLCGAVIVRPDNSIASTGYNGFPRGVIETHERRQRPRKYLFSEHAERNAIYNCHDASLEGYSIFIYTYPNNLFVCADCARGIVQTGIKHVYITHDGGGDSPHWEESCSAAKDMFDEAGVEIHQVEINLTSLIEKLQELRNDRTEHQWQITRLDDHMANCHCSVCDTTETVNLDTSVPTKYGCNINKL